MFGSMGATELVLILMIVTVGWFVVKVVKGFRESDQPPAPLPVLEPRRIKGMESLPEEAYPDELLPATEDDELDFEYEAFAAKARWRVWIRYEDAQGAETERKIEIHAPQEDSYIFAWCCRAKAPRTFRRDRILEFKILNEHFDFKPALDRWFREEWPKGDRAISWEDYMKKRIPP